MSEVSVKNFKGGPHTLVFCTSCWKGLPHDGNRWRGVAYLYCKRCDRLWWAGTETMKES